MTTPKTKAEALKEIGRLEGLASQYEAYSKRHPALGKSEAGKAAASFRARVVRLRDLLPTLPEAL